MGSGYIEAKPTTADDTTERSKAAMDTRSLEGKIAIITGASRGIGKATALMMAQRGVKGVRNHWCH